MEQPIIHVNDVTFRYHEEDERPALNSVSLSVIKGEWLAVVGHNGSGKSTLARVLNGLILPQKGNVIVNGITLNEDSVWEIRKQIGMVFQNPDNQFVGTTVKDDVAFGLENHGVPREVMKKRVEWATHKVKMEAFLDQEPHHLSGGQKQRVAIAGVIAVQPQIIILDEATSMLDPQGRKEVMETVRELKDQGIVTVISITHDLEEASKADRIVVMNGGEKFAEGTPETIFKLDQKLVEIGLDLPFPYRVSMKLREAGVNLTSNHLDEESLVNELWILHSKS
ncbi:energy-coupling factor ABC transporter ATP-binding protein [Bacillus sp. CMF21]|uniref:energy-coupling factor ABC transporter ATP-binding protein n=1 Tax=Metabacillus dongyingensis TaxID=2874282 RepID=UPI001CBADD58|nr:energy-coupling factor ABC transporter ATP-binding protein [Metabacillus dongyingensis]UAL52471.1 energy-coupling factor ABC transporter ATP-binding protein [Metabacillus dongyingensis]UOK58179.1 energy-coupling factor ABC transporter ATP-binding protein [Bacillus sp. OVS6]USK28782.1 energy-coupling factor ABC transporter ATP-binding protein [Bacillus sp. CMF21]